jgi:hypothetical protein
MIALLMVALVLLLNALAASPSLHEWFHADAGSAHHRCAVTMFAHGQVDTASVDVPVAVPVTLGDIVVPAEISFYHPSIDNLPAGRGPPVSVLHS